MANLELGYSQTATSLITITPLHHYNPHLQIHTLLHAAAVTENKDRPLSAMTMSVLGSTTCKATGIAKGCPSHVARPLLASSARGATRPTVRNYAQVSKEDNQGMVQFQPFDEVSVVANTFDPLYGSIFVRRRYSAQVKDELAKVNDSEEQTMEDSFARAGYSREAEQAVNEQIK